MIYIYHYQLFDGHIIVPVEQKNLLIDTGAPMSVGDTTQLSLAGHRFSVQDSYIGVDVRSLSSYIGKPINALIGADILNKFDIIIDSYKGEIQISEDDLPLPNNILAIDQFMGIPILSVSVDKKEVRMFFDTGAKLSYLEPNISRLYSNVGEETDFYPGIGVFATPTFEVSIKIGSESILLKVGNLPQLLQNMLTMAGIGGILGTAILNDYNIFLSPKRRCLSLERKQIVPG